MRRSSTPTDQLSIDLPSSFAGFPRGTLRFLGALRVHNNPEWFRDHRPDYDAYCVGPAKAFVVAAGERLSAFAPGIRAEPRIFGSIFRINRATRFGKDKRRYKDHLDVWFWEGERTQAVSGFFMRLTPETVGAGAGCHHFDKNGLEAFRRAVVDPERGAELEAVVRDLEPAGYELGGRHYKRTPKGLTGQGIGGRFLLHNALYAHRDKPVDESVHTPSVLDECVRVWQDLSPLHRWITDNVQAR